MNGITKNNNSSNYSQLSNIKPLQLHLFNNNLQQKQMSTFIGEEEDNNNSSINLISSKKYHQQKEYLNNGINNGVN